MSIYSDDLKIMKAQVMLDTDDGGGGMTAERVVDGQSNNLFPDISELDRVYGRISLRKGFAWIDTPNTDSYFGAHIILDKKPLDPKVSVALFSTRDSFDRRLNAKDRVESYLAKGTKWTGHLLELQLTGQRAIQQVMRPEDAEPVTGQGLVLVANEGTPAQYEQYVRATGVAAAEQNFSIGVDKTVRRKVVTIELSDPLRFDFEGSTVKDFEAGSPSGTAVLRDTRIADAASYYGIASLGQPAAIASATLVAQNIFTNIVPSSQQEVPLIDLDAASQSAALIAGSLAPITIGITAQLNTNAALYLGSPVLAGSVSFLLSGQTVTDSGGELKRGGVLVGLIDYAAGVLSWTENAGGGAQFLNIQFTPAAVLPKPARSFSRAVTADNRGFNWVTALVPVPAPTTVTVSYMAQNKVYTLRDDGGGRLRGLDSAFGSGTVNYETGTVLLTTGALPDVGSLIIYTWGTPLATYVRAGLTLPPATVEMNLSHQGIAAATLSVSWPFESGVKTASDDGNGALTGDATGVVDYATGRVSIRPNLLPQNGAIFSAAYQYGEAKTATISGVTPNGTQQATINIAGSGALVPYSVRVRVPVCNVSTDLPRSYGFVELRDRPTSGGAGEMVNSKGVVMGSINYASREVVFSPSTEVIYYKTIYETSSPTGWQQSVFASA